MNEVELIKGLTASLPTNPTVVVGSGDDCAVLDLGIPGHFLLFKTDAVVEHIHFTPEAIPEQVGHKALGRCLSDIAAMGGWPNSALVTIGLPRSYDPQRVERMYAGLKNLASRFGVAVVGGETTENPGGALLSVALIGRAPKGKCILRSGAQPGDAIFVTGRLGGSLSGKHLIFEPRLEEARWLAETFALHAMIDLSDGLASDLRHVLAASGVGAELLGRAIPISREARQDKSRPALLAALTDGEDFELLFTLSSKEAVPLIDAWKGQFPDLALTCVGKITEEPGLRMRDNQGIRPVSVHGYTHFQQP